MKNLFYFLSILKLLAPFIKGAVTGAVSPFLDGLAMFFRSLWDATDTTANRMMFNAMNGRVLPSAWSDILYVFFRTISVLWVIIMWVLLARFTVWLPRFLSWLFDVLS